MENSVEVAPLAPAGEGRLSSGLLRFQGWSLLVLLVWLYYSIFYHLVVQWITDQNFQHGIFVPAFSLFVLWQDRQRLKSVGSKPSWAGLPLVVLALVMLVLGVLGVELFTSRLSLLILLAGLIILFRGWEFFRAVLFPWAFLVLMIPIPGLILQRFTFPLQMLAAKLATFMLQIVGVPALREGNIIYLPHMTLEVADACSGIRSLLTLLTLAIIYGYLMEKRKWVRVALACSAVPIAVAANGFRIFGTGILGEYWDPDKAQGFFHEFQGWLIFVVSLILLFTLHRLINVIWKSTPGGKTESPPRVEAHRPELKKTPGAPGPMRNWSPRFLIPALLMLVTATGLAYSGGEIVPTNHPCSHSLPVQFPGWTSTDAPFDPRTLEILGPGEFLDRDYNDADQLQPWINLFVAYYPTQKMGDTIHSPDHCLPGGGWIPTVRQVVQLKSPDGGSFPVNRYVVTNAGERQIVLYWFQAHGRAVASEWSAKYYLILDSIRMRRSDGGMVRLMSPIYQGESLDDAQARVMKIGNQILPQLDTCIPR